MKWFLGLLSKEKVYKEFKAGNNVVQGNERQVFDKIWTWFCRIV